MLSSLEDKESDRLLRTCTTVSMDMEEIPLGAAVASYRKVHYLARHLHIRKLAIKYLTLPDELSSMGDKDDIRLCTFAHLDLCSWVC